MDNVTHHNIFIESVMLVTEPRGDCEVHMWPVTIYTFVPSDIRCTWTDNNTPQNFDNFD